MNPKLVLAVLGVILETLSFAVAIPVLVPVGVILIGIAVIVPAP